MKTYSTFIKSQQCVSINRLGNICKYSLDGVILKEGDDLLLVKFEYDFQFDGYIVLRKRDIKNVCYNKTSKYHEMILRNEKLYTGMRKPIKCSLNSIEDVLKYLFDKSEVAIFEVEGPDYKMFLLGRIDSYNNKVVKVWHIDSVGKVKNKPTTIKIDDITIIQFKNRYIRMFDKYKGNNFA